MLSASKGGLLRACQYWARPDVEQDARTETPEAARGTGVHYAIDHFVKTGKTEYTVESPEQEAMVRHAIAWLEPHICVESEVPFAWDPMTDKGYELNLSRQREYAEPGVMAGIAQRRGMSNHAIPMTVDILERVGNTATIYDWCTGHTYKLAQLQMNALAVARANNFDEVRIVTLRLTASGVTEEDHGTLVDFDLAMLAAEFRALVDAIPMSQPQPGMHCTEFYCPAKQSCPTTRTAIEQIIPTEHLARFKFSHELTSAEHASAVLPMWKLANDYVDLVGKALREFARTNGAIPTSPGKEWGEGTRKMPRFNKDAALALLLRLGANESEMAALTKTSVETVFSERKAAK